MKTPSQKSILYIVLQNIKKNCLIDANDVVIVALSGGPDSVCLFDVLFRLRAKLKIKLLACHYNHRLRGEESYNDEEFVRKICAERGIECIFGMAADENLYKNEESARAARYAFFEKILGERRGVKIAIAHNKNDLSETFLMRLFRGTGILGLLSIPSVRGNFIRPLLPVSRREIENYLKEERLSCQTDRTNNDIKITRNYLRLKIMPLLKHINPNLVETLANSAELLGDDYRLLSELANTEYEKIVVQERNENLSLDRKKWLSLHPSLRRMVLRKAISEKTGLSDITNIQISEVYELINKGEGKKHKVLPHSLRIELVSGKILVSKNQKT